MFRIYYADGTVREGLTKRDWTAAPDDGVQVVVRFPKTQPLRWHCSTGPVRDRDLWTGDDEYDPFGWGPKRGSLIGDAAYRAIWEQACGDD